MSDIFGNEEDSELPKNPETQEVQPETTTEVAEKPEKQEVQPSVPQVPIHALHEARAEIAELRGQNKKYEGMYEEVQAWRKSQQQGQDTDKFNADPLGSIRDDIQSLKTSQEQRDQQAQEQTQATENENQLLSQVQSYVTEFTKNNTDYQDALTHVLDSRAQELRMMGTPEAQIQQALQQESMGLAQNAIATGGNPAEVVYNLAKLRGYTPSAKPAALDQIEKGQQASTTLPSGANEGPSLLDVEQMSDEEFDEYWKKEIEPNRH